MMLAKTWKPHSNLSLMQKLLPDAKALTLTISKEYYRMLVCVCVYFQRSKNCVLYKLKATIVFRQIQYLNEWMKTKEFKSQQKRNRAVSRAKLIHSIALSVLIRSSTAPSCGDKTTPTSRPAAELRWRARDSCYY